MDLADKVHENRLRRWAKRLGLELKKSRARTLKIDDRGGWQILDAKRNRVKAGQIFQLDLETVEMYLGAVEKDLAGELTIDPAVIAARRGPLIIDPAYRAGELAPPRRLGRLRPLA